MITVPSGSTMRVCAESPLTATSMNTSVHTPAATGIARLSLIVTPPEYHACHYCSARIVPCRLLMLGSEGEPRSNAGLEALALRGHGAFPEVRIVRHVTRERRVMPEHGVLDDRLPRAHRIEEIPQVRPDVVVARSAERDRLPHRRLTRLGVVLLAPLLEVRVAQCPRKAVGVVAGRLVLSALWREGDLRTRDFEDAL